MRTSLCYGPKRLIASSVCIVGAQARFLGCTRPFLHSNPKTLRSWFEEIVSLSDVGGSKVVGSQAAIKGSRMLTEARLLISSEGWDDGGTSSIPEVIVERLWAVVDSVFGADETTVDIEASQYRFLSLLAEVSEDSERITDLLKRLHDCDQKGERRSSEMAKLVRDLGEATVPLYQRWLQQSAFTHIVYGGETGDAAGLPGMTRLIQFRQHLLETTKRLRSRIKDGSVAAVAPEGTADVGKWGEDIKAAVGRVEGTVFALLRRWMRNGSGMELSELRWDKTPPSTFEMIIAAESVHPFEYPGLEGMRLRVQPTQVGSSCRRHLYCFLHREAPNLPLIAVQVALWNGVAASVDDVLQRPKVYDRREEEVEEIADGLGSKGGSNSAIFYSINNVQPGLRGVELGSTLIKTVVARLEQDAGSAHRQMPPIDHYSTLSPIPGFMSWFKATAAQLADGSDRPLSKAILDTQSPLFGLVGDDSLGLPPIDIAQLDALVEDVRSALVCAGYTHVPTDCTLLPMLLDTLSTPTAGEEWYANADVVAKLKRPLMRSIACYLIQMRKRGRAMDAVTNFHVGNGAEVLRINWMGNQTPKGSSESCCAMVNYYYNSKTLSNNALDYQSKGNVPLGAPLKRQLSGL